MKRWLTTQQMANDIAAIDKSNNKQLNIAQCNAIAKNIKNLYCKRGKDYMLNHLRNTLSGSTAINGFTMDQKERAIAVVKRLFRWHWFPLSRIRNNMRRLCEA